METYGIVLFQISLRNQTKAMVRVPDSNHSTRLLDGTGLRQVRRLSEQRAGLTRPLQKTDKRGQALSPPLQRRTAA